MTKEVEAIHRQDGIALFTDGTMMHIDNWYDDSGDDCAPEDATFCVFEDIRTGGYWNVDLTQFERMKQ